MKKTDHNTTRTNEQYPERGSRGDMVTTGEEE